MSNCCGHKNEGIQSIVLNAKGMSCDHCVKSIQKGVEGLKGVSKVDVDLQGSKVTVEYNSADTNVDAIKTAIEDTGYDVE